jgi:hypothetical protein
LPKLVQVGLRNPLAGSQGPVVYDWNPISRGVHIQFDPVGIHVARAAKRGKGIFVFVR